MTPRRILVTGSAGFLGSAAVARLAARPEIESVIAVDVKPGEPPTAGVVTVQRDVADGIGDLLEAHAVDAVLHHAYVIRPSRDPATARDVNVTATKRLAEDAAAAGVARIVYPSSTTVYGAWPGAAPHREDESPRPVPGFAYSEHKVEAERALRTVESQDGPSVTILRSCVVAGRGARGFIFDSLSLPVLPVIAGHDPEMQFLHIDDYLDAALVALQAPTTGTYNIAGIGTVRVREMARIIGSRLLPVPGRVLRSMIGWSWRLRWQHRSPASGLQLITHPWLVSTDAIERELGWSPRWTSEEAICAWAGRHARG